MGLGVLRHAFHKRLVLSCLGIVSIMIVLSGCFGGGGGGGGTTPSEGTIRGYVTEIDPFGLRGDATFGGSGPGVEGARVSLVGTSKVAQASSVGEFTISGIRPGTYDIAVTRNGWSTTVMSGVVVEANKTTWVGLRMAKRDAGSRPAETIAPTVSISCPSPARGTVSVPLSASDEGGILGVGVLVDDLPVWGIGTGQPPATHFETTCTWITYSEEEGCGWGNGTHAVTALAVDSSLNIGMRTIKVQIDNPVGSGAVPYAPVSVYVFADTTHYSVYDLLWSLLFEWDYAQEQVETIVKGAGMPVMPRLTDRPGTRGTPSGSDSVIDCHVLWDVDPYSPVPGGFRVYRDGTMLGDLPASGGLHGSDPGDPADLGDPGDFGRAWVDSSPSLCVGTRYEYEVSAYNATGQGPKSEAIGVTPLAPLTRVYLESPADGEVVTSLEPILSWDPVSGAERYTIVVSHWTPDSLDQVWGGSVPAGVTSVVYGDLYYTPGSAPCEPLIPGQTYIWHVFALASEEYPVLGDDSISSAMSASASEIRTFITDVNAE